VANDFSFDDDGEAAVKAARASERSFGYSDGGD